MREPKGRLAQKRERSAEFRRRYHEQRKQGGDQAKDFDEEKPRIKRESKIKKQYKEYFASLAEERLKKGKGLELEEKVESIAEIKDEKTKTAKTEGVIVTGSAHSKSGVIRQASIKKVQEQDNIDLEDEDQKKLSEEKKEEFTYKVPKDTSMLDNVR